MTSAVAIAARGLTLACLLAPCGAAQAPRTMVEELRIGGADDGPARFARIFAVAAAPNGNIFVVDGPPIQLKLFSAEGELVRQQRIPFSVLTRRWTGAIAPDGGLLDPVTIVPRGGIPVPSDRPRAAGIRRVLPDGAVADTTPVPYYSFRRPYPNAITFGRNGQVTMVLQTPFLPQTRTLLTTEGYAWCSPLDEYVAVRFRAGSADTLAVVRKEVRARPIPRDTLQKIIAALGRTAEKYGGSSYRQGDLPSTLPVIETVEIDDQGRLWVRRTDTPASAPRFDLFDASGRELGTVTSRVPFVGIPIVVGDLAYGIVRDTDDVPYVVRARLR